MKRFNERWIQAGIVIIMVLVPGLLYLPGVMGKIPFPGETSQFSDLLISHYPYSLILKESLLNFQALPLWSSLIYSGAPLAGNPLAGLFYLPGWLAMLFPLPAGISLALMAHVFFGTWGFYRLLRESGVELLGAVAGGLTFGLLPKLAAHYGAGHVTLIYAVCWTPWLFLISKKDSHGWKSGIIAGMLFLADPRWSIYAGIIWISYDIAYRQGVNLSQRLIYWSKTLLSAVLVSAPLLLPLVEFSLRSTRILMTGSDILANSLPVELLMGVLIPGSGGNPEWVLYAGGVGICLALVQFADTEFRKRNLFWSVWFIGGIVISLSAGFIPGVWIEKIPLISMLRVPARWLFVSGIALAFLTGSILDQIQEYQRSQRSLRNILAGVILFAGLMVAGLLLMSELSNLMLVWGLGVLFASACIMLLGILLDRMKSASWLMLGILVLDLGLINQKFVDFRDPGQIYTNQAGWDEVLNQDQGSYRTYSPSYSVPQNLAAENDWELADGVDPLQLAVYKDFMDTGTGISADLYSVSIPPFKTGNPQQDNRGSSPDLNYLSLLNVKYIISAFELDLNNLDRLSVESGIYVYQNLQYFPRAWVELGETTPEIDNLSEIKFETAKVIQHRPNLVATRASGPGRLVLSEIHYPGWFASIDGEPAHIEPAYQILRSVQLEEGEHDIVFKYNPVSVYIGLAMAAGLWLNGLLSVLRRLV